MVIRQKKQKKLKKNTLPLGFFPFLLFILSDYLFMKIKVLQKTP